MAGLHVDDPVSASGLLHRGGLLPDDCVGQRKAPQLPERVPRLPTSPLSHPAFRSVEHYIALAVHNITLPPQPFPPSFYKSKVHVSIKFPFLLGILLPFPFQLNKITSFLIILFLALLLDPSLNQVGLLGSTDTILYLES